jgi:hypothetical protein
MKPIVKNILAVIVGLIAGSLVNMGIIMISGSIIPPPEGVDNTTMEGLKAGMHLFQPIHFFISVSGPCNRNFCGSAGYYVYRVKPKNTLLFNCWSIFYDWWNNKCSYATISTVVYIC